MDAMTFRKAYVSRKYESSILAGTSTFKARLSLDENGHHRLTFGVKVTKLLMALKMAGIEYAIVLPMGKRSGDASLYLRA